jgi:hypothetical protein
MYTFVCSVYVQVVKHLLKTLMSFFPNQIPWVWTPLTAGREIIFLSLFMLIVKLSIPVIQVMIPVLFNTRCSSSSC